jgi:hypothetical protein
MNEQEFLIVAGNQKTAVNIWYTDTLPYTIKGITVPTLDSKGGQDISRYLQQVEVITVAISEGKYISLSILETTSLGSYYYFRVKEVTIQDTGDQFIAGSPLYISPGILGSDYTNSPYNIIQGTAQVSRQSQYVMQSDRASQTTTQVGAGIPTNIENLQSGLATKAYIQDSLYSDTGWTRARYDGTPTTAITYGGIDPAIQGNVFKGSYFTRTTLDSRIFSQSEANITYTDYLFTGTQEIPQYTTEYTNSTLTTNIGETQQIISISNTSKTAMQIRPGDLLKFSSNATPPANLPEIFQVKSVNIISAIQRDLTVVRGWDQTPTRSLASTSPTKFLHKITPVQIYKLSGNKIQGESRGKVKVQQTGDIIYTDILGFVATGSLN